ncbi:MAG: sigma 54-interacting transcriptional regulator [Myxococcales bacterium]|nr:sigma 54-interacting transcriptional regulator [Myxococcales bacterium]MBL0195458.1 sigma 54-interacting transcriptional regulator [Myxococcales bacterium]
MDADTERLDEEDRARAAPGSPGASRLSLLVYHPGGAQAIELETGRAVVVGRGDAPAGTLQDATLSRKHARFTRGAGTDVECEDLGASNGTWFRGRRVTKVVLAPGDEVRLGAVVVEVHARAASLVGTRPPPAEELGRPILASAAIRAVFAELARAAASAIPVLLQGETGAGKEVAARALHEGGPRAAGPMLTVSCAAIPEGLVESTLFGHEKGAFTGAGERRRGAFEVASGGTLLLDEIGELPLHGQAALLRVLESNLVVRVGSTRELPVDVRVVAATNRDLQARVREGGFRADLLYRLNGLTLTVPPLRERRDDIRPLAEAFLQRAVARTGAAARTLDAAALDALTAYAWPGNVRELRNVVERALVVSARDPITLAELPPHVASPVAEARGPEPARPAGRPAEAARDLRATVQSYERKIIAEALAASSGNQTEAAKRLNMPLRTFVRKVKALNLR